jgi:hypothetical protein
MAGKDETATLTTDDKFQMLLEVLAQNKNTSGLTKDDLAELLSGQAQSMKKALKPENDEHPNKSAFHPNGGPFLNLGHEVYYNNFPVHKAIETHHDRELELFTQLTPGIYRVLRKDLSDMTVTVRADTTPTGKITKLFVEFPVAREEKAQIPPMHVVLYQIVHNNMPAPQRYAAAVNDHMQAMLVGMES